MTDDYKDCLRAHGLKSTKARNGVLAILSRNTRVITVEAVYAALLEQGWTPEVRYIASNRTVMVVRSAVIR